MIDQLHLMFNFVFKVSCDVFKNKHECQLATMFFSKISPQCHMPISMCHFNL